MIWMLAQRMSQDELLRSLSSNMGGSGGDDTGGAGAFVLVLLAALVAILLLAWASRRRRLVDKRLHHPGKLQREITRKVGLKPAELKKLKTLADDVDAGSPLVLLLCPSLMADASRKRRSR